MSTPSELYRNAIDLNRFSNSVAKRIAVTYNDLILFAVAELRGIDELTAPAKAARLRAILAQLKESLDGWAETSTLTVTDDLQGLAVLQSEYVANELRQALPVNMRTQIRNVQISPQFAQAVATVDPTAINVVALSDDLQAAVEGVQQTFQLTATQGTAITLPNGKVLNKSFRGLAESQAELFSKTVRNGLLTGESSAQIARRLKGRLQFGDLGPLSPGQVRAAGLSMQQLVQAGGELTSVSNRQVMALVRTSVNQVATEARQQVYKANPDIVKRYRYVAVLDSRTSAICRALDGKVFVLGKGPMPPQHFNCRSTHVAVIDYKGLGIEPPPPSKLRRPNTAFGPLQRGIRGDSVPGNQTYGEWLNKQPRAVQEDVLGKGKVPYFNRLVRRYGPQDAIRKFVSADGSELTLKELKLRYPDD